MTSILSQPHFHNEDAAYAFVEARLWANGTICPHCGVIGADESGESFERAIGFVVQRPTAQQRRDRDCE